MAYLEEVLEKLEGYGEPNKDYLKRMARFVLSNPPSPFDSPENLQKMLLARKQDEITENLITALREVVESWSDPQAQVEMNVSNLDDNAKQRLSDLNRFFQFTLVNAVREAQKAKSVPSPSQPTSTSEHRAAPLRTSVSTSVPTKAATNPITTTPKDVVNDVLVTLKNQIPALPKVEAKRSLEEGKLQLKHAVIDFLVKPDVTDEALTNMLKTSKSDPAGFRGLQRLAQARAKIPLSDLQEIRHLAKILQKNPSEEAITNLLGKLNDLTKPNPPKGPLFPPTTKMGALCSQMLDVVKQIDANYKEKFKSGTGLARRKFD